MALFNLFQKEEKMARELCSKLTNWNKTVDRDHLLSSILKIAPLYLGTLKEAMNLLQELQGKNHVSKATIRKLRGELRNATFRFTFYQSLSFVLLIKINKLEDDKKKLEDVLNKLEGAYPSVGPYLRNHLKLVK
jgi:hypothetical protein